MRRLIGTSNGVRIARMPWPIEEPGRILVRVEASLVSPGTELAPYRAAAAEASGSAITRFQSKVGRTAHYARLAVRHPDKAAAKIGRIAKAILRQGLVVQSGGPSDMSDQGWSLGYSVAGSVLSVGEGVSGFAIGDRVACAGAGMANHADVISVPVNLVCKAPAIRAEHAAFATLGAIALQGLRRAEPQLGETVAVIGLGLLGILTVQMLVANGCRVLGFDTDPKRVRRASEFGMDGGSHEEKAFLAGLADLSGGLGADCVLVCAASGSNRPVNLGMEAVRRKGRVVLVGDVGLAVERPMFYRKEADLLISTSYGPGRYDIDYEERGRDYPPAYVRWTAQRNMQSFLDMVATGRVRVDDMIDRVIPIESAEAAYADLVANSASEPILAVVLSYKWDERASDGKEGCIALRGGAVRARGMAFALVGTGAFGQSMLLPAFRSETGFSLWGVVSRDGVRGGNLVRQEGGGHVASSVEAALASPSPPRMVVIASRHDRHAGEVVAALSAGCHAFVEKPLALTWDQLDRVAEAHDGRALLMVGYNRRFSPAVLALGQALQGRRGPLVMVYRMNAGRISRDHWIQGPEGGGRNLGEACHAYDVLRALSCAPARSVQAVSIDPAATDWLRNDNFAATITYGDGSLGTLIYTAMGPKQGMAKERLEVFCDGESYLLDDFKILTRSSDGAVLWSGATDKGHREEVRRFCAAIRDGGESPIAFDELIETSAVALTVEDLLAGRGADS